MRHSTARWAMRLKLGAAPSAVASMSSTISSSVSFSLKIFTALMGSPTYLGSRNCTVFTRPPFLTSKQGMILGLSNLQLGEILQESRPEVMALLGMELHAEDVIGVHGRAEVDPVARHREGILALGALEEEGMQEVEPRVGLEPVEERVLGHGPHVVPSHVRERKAAGGVERGEPPHPAVDPAESRKLPFVARARQHLHADAHPQDGHAPLQDQLVQHLAHP